MEFPVGFKTLTFDSEIKTISYDGKTWEPSVRTYANMKQLYQKQIEFEDSLWLYYMYRGVYFDDAHRELFEKHKLRYDITIIACNMIGQEYNKTYGHFHPTNSQGHFYEEIYEVLAGNAVSLQQNSEKTFYIKAKARDKILMKPSFGHVTINESETEFLVLANIVSSEFDSIYTEYDLNKWARYYYKTTGWERNPNYTDDMPLEELSDKFDSANTIYADFLNNPERYNFLK